MQHVSDMIVQHLNIFLAPSLQGLAVRKDGVVSVVEVGGDAVSATRLGSLVCLDSSRLLFRDFFS